MGLRMGRVGESIADDDDGSMVPFEMGRFLNNHEGVVEKKGCACPREKFTVKSTTSDAPTQLGSVVYCPLGTNQVTVALVTPSFFPNSG